MFIKKAFAETGPDAYTKAVIRQYSNQYGVSNRAASRAVRTMANGHKPFQPVRGRNASRTSVLRQASRLSRG